MSPIRAVAPDAITIKHIDLSKPNRLHLVCRGLKAVIQHGWNEFGSSLLTVSYSDIFRQQTREIDRLRSLPATPAACSQPDFKAAETEADRIGARLQELYPHEGSAPFYAFAEDNKYWVAGKQKGEDYPLTRIYIGQRIDTAPDTFNRLIKELQSRGCLAFIDIALNREIFFPGESSLENNAIIIYVMKNDREVLRNVCQAIEAAQVDSGLTAAERARLKEDNIRDFLVPLADNVAFVEMENNRSYHFETRHRLFIEIFGRTPFLSKLSLAEIQQVLDLWSPENPGFFQGKPQRLVLCDGKPMLYPPNLLANRRKYMPALVL
jgi:hypothetical protein